MGIPKSAQKEPKMNISNSYNTYTYSTYSNSTATSSRSSEFAELLMASLDTDSSSSIDATEFSEAALALSLGEEDSINEAFSLLDEDGNGVVSMDELTSYMASTEQMMAAGGPPPPPPPPPPSNSEEEDSGYTQEELSALAEDSASTDPNLSSLFETLAANFDEADANGDGKVTSEEAMAYKEETSQQDTALNGEDLMNALMQQVISHYSSEASKESTLNLSA